MGVVADRSGNSFGKLGHVLVIDGRGFAAIEAKGKDQGVNHLLLRSLGPWHAS